MTLHFGLVLIFLLTVCNSPYQVVSSHCVMYGICGESDYGEETCSYNGTAISLDNEEVHKTFKEICPDVYHESDLLCCSAEQVDRLKTNLDLSVAVGLGRCPSCIANFRKNFCEFVCSPRQSDFLKVTRLGQSDKGDAVIDKISYYMSREYADGMFASCKDIQFLTPGSTVLDIMCGAWSGRDCTAERWLKFLGTASGTEINYHLTSESHMIINGETFIPMNENTTSCSESPYPGADACTCADCPSAC